MAVSDFLRAELQARGWTKTVLARKAGFSKQIVSQWLAENPAERIVPSPASCEKIAEALDVDPDYVLELAGHRKPRPDRPVVNLAESELEARLARLGGTLAKYPRVVWLAVLEANDRMAEALAHQSEPPVSAPESGRVNAPASPVTRGDPRHKRRLTSSQHALVAAGAAA